VFGGVRSPARVFFFFFFFLDGSKVALITYTDMTSEFTLKMLKILRCEMNKGPLGQSDEHINDRSATYGFTS